MGGPVRFATVCLDAKSTQELAQFTGSTALVRREDELSDYLGDDEELPARWTRRPAFEICLIDFDGNRNRARATAERLIPAYPAWRFLRFRAMRSPI